MATSSNIYSNAFNFLSFVETGVDPRTGQYTCGLSLPELNNNDLAGPEIPLRIGYNPLNTFDSGFGKGWTLQLTQYDTESDLISLATGGTFKVTSRASGSNQLLMKDKKIDNFHLHDLDNKRYRVVHKSGVVEELAVVGPGFLALPVAIASPAGHRVTLDYGSWNGQPMLRSISDGDGSELLAISRESTRASLVLHPGQAWESRYSLVFSGSESRVSRIELPTDNLASWRFQYEVHEGLLCISRVEGPLGGHERITYDDGAHLFPQGVRRLPRVHRHLKDPGAAQDVIETRYDYSSHNFLGYDAPGLSWEDNGEDNLYKVLGDYTYSSTEHLWDALASAPLRSTKRTFNRFHLIVNEQTEQGDCVKQVISEYHTLDGVAFIDQPAKCQLPKTVTNTWYRKSESGRQRKDEVFTDFDEHGNETLRIEANGIREASEWYAAKGEAGCPEDPQGFVRHLKSKTVTPHDTGYGEAPTLRTDYRYASLPALDSASPPWLVKVEEALFNTAGDVELHKELTYHFNQPDDPFQHGRTSQTEIILAGKHTFTDFFYTKAQGRRADESVLRVMESLSSSFDKSAKTIIREQSLVNGEPLLEVDDNDVEIAYRYDSLNRVVEEIVAPDTPFEATRSYSYVLVSSPGAEASQTLTDVRKVQTRTCFDGLQRVVLEQRQPPGKALRDVHRAKHDRFGQLQESSEIDWLDDEEKQIDLVLSSQYSYDDWGEQDGVTGPDGVTLHTENNPVAREVQTWRDGEGRTVTRSNPFDKPDSIERLDLAGKPYSKKEYFYDGLGRTNHDFDEMQQFRFYQYDAFDRVTLSAVPGTTDTTMIERRYASHSRQELPVWIGVDDVTLGEQGFDGLGRRTELTVGPRHETYAYDGGRMQPRERTTPKGETLAYEYTPQLTQELTGLIATDEEATYGYDPADAQLRWSQNRQGRREFDYDSASHLSAERWIEGGKTWAASYRHSRQGRQLLHGDVNGLEVISGYDSAGRLKEVAHGRVEVEHEYDSSSRPYITTCRDLDAGSELVTTLAFDDWGREVGRTLALSGQPSQTITQTWRPDDRLLSRHRQSAGQSLLQETFDYDPRGRLSRHTCAGSQLPRDRYGNAIVEQVFTYDGMDNLTDVETRFADGSEDISARRFADDDPCQLVHLSHTHADYPASLELSYDANGNLLEDENGNTLVYDSQSRLLEVRDTGDQLIARYHYDAHNQLSGEIQGSAVQTQRFYHGDRLGCSVQGTTRISYLHGEDRPLAQQQVGSATQTLLLLTDANRSVFAESQQKNLRQTGYSAYGAGSDDALHCPLAFNGEWRDRQTGWYLLGNGYRAYNPFLMCFHSPDSLSPFDKGGINTYMYCAGDPINFRDPTGHFLDIFPDWTTPAFAIAGLALGVLSLGSSLGAMAAAGGLVKALTSGGLLTQTVLVGGLVSAGTGIASLMVSDVTTKRALGFASFVTGVVAAGAAATSLLRYGWLGKAGKLGKLGKAGQFADDAGSVASKTPTVKAPNLKEPLSPTQPADDLVNAYGPKSSSATFNDLTEIPMDRIIPRANITSNPNRIASNNAPRARGGSTGDIGRDSQMIRQPNF